MKILVVDDEELLVKGIKFNLENEGYEVDVCYDGQTAVDGSDRCPLADNVAYYIYDRNAGSTSSAYTLASRTQVLAEGYTLSAWYDTPPSQGGRVRVVLAQK